VAVAARTVKKGDPTLGHAMSVHTPDDRPLPGTLEETAELITAEGREALPVRMDLLDLASIDSAVQTVLDEWGALDLVVNNGRHVGPGLMDSILDTPIDEFGKYLQAHGPASIRIVQLTLPAMLERGEGTFVTVSSGAGTDFYPTAAPGEPAFSGLAYKMAKAAQHMLAGEILAEYGDRGIRAFNVNPGYVRTERNVMSTDTTHMDPAAGAPPEAIGAAVAWLVTSPEGNDLLRTNVDAQPMALERGLYPDWRTAVA
jgi:NAD(P)-dependent dehydrogenase (short-subunit alcohol dehydrogenase family)